MQVTRCVSLLLVVAAVCGGRRLHHARPGPQHMLLIDLPEQREGDQPEAAKPAELLTVAEDTAEKTENQDRETEDTAEKTENQDRETEVQPAGPAAVETGRTEGEMETAEDKTEHRPTRIVKRQCYGCAEVVCSCPDCGRR